MMRTRSAILATLCVVIPFVLRAQYRSPFKNLRYDEQYVALCSDTTHHSLYARLKHTQRNNAVFSLGGEFRLQFFSIRNQDWGETDEGTDDYLLSRYLLHANINVGKHFRLFAQLQGGHADWKKDVSPVDQNVTDAHQLFGDYTFAGASGGSIIVRAGRQEMLYGSQRLVSVREGPNYRQSFDAVRVIVTQQRHSINAFYGHHVDVRTGAFNDRPSGNIKFYGVYGTRKGDRTNLDLYGFGYHKRDALYQNAYGTENRYSLGARFWKIAKNFSYDAELVAQFGSIGSNSIGAGTASVSMSYAFAKTLLHPEIGFKTEAITGDRRTNDGATNTFNAMFPRGAYFGLAALFAPANLVDVHPSLTVWFHPTVALTVDYDAFWRYSTADGLYTFGGDLMYGGHAGHARYIGEQVAAEVSYEPNIFIKCSTEFKWFNAGPYLQQAGRGKDICFIMVQVQVKF